MTQEHKRLLEDMYGETEADFLRGEDESRRRQYLNDISWDILDMIPEGKELDVIRDYIIEIIIEKGWDRDE